MRLGKLPLEVCFLLRGREDRCQAVDEVGMLLSYAFQYSHLISLAAREHAHLASFPLRGSLCTTCESITGRMC